LPKYLLPALLLILHLAAPAHGQQIDDVDEAFQNALELAHAGEYEVARGICSAILRTAPDYHDVRILKARTYEWEGHYEQASDELYFVLELSPGHAGAYEALIDNEIWANNFDAAVEAAKKAVSYHSLDESLLLKLATAYYYSGREREAMNVITQIKQINPANREAMELRESIQLADQNYAFTVSYTHDRFSEIFDPWNSGYLQLSRATRIGTILGRINTASRFETTAIQPEIDFYPLIADGWYGYLNVGLSSNRLYPEVRLGGELHHRLMRVLEASAGMRQLRYTHENITIFTGSLSGYIGNWMITARPYFTPGDHGVSRSLNLFIRRYFPMRTTT
jgi:tetratricopeptide (TPR) repeat protein